MSQNKPSSKPTVEPKPGKSIEGRAKRRPSELIQKSQQDFEELKNLPDIPDKYEVNRKKYIKGYEWLKKPGRKAHHHVIEFKTKREEQKIGLKDLISCDCIKIRIGSGNRAHPERRGRTFFAERAENGNYYFMDPIGKKKERVKIFTGDMFVPDWNFNNRMAEEYFTLKKRVDKDTIAKIKEDLIKKEISKEALFAYDNMYTKGIAPLLNEYRKLFDPEGTRFNEPEMWNSLHDALSIRGGTYFSKKYVDKFKWIFGEYPKAYKSPLVEFVAKLGLSGKQQEYLLANLLKRRPDFDITKKANQNLLKRVAKEYRKIASIPKRKGRETYEREPAKIARRSRPKSEK